jgi:asparagine synthase (glutamine-hydrolysing)
LPLEQKVRDGQGKWLLRQLLYRHVPYEIVERPKQGFGVPIEHWLRGPLRDWAEDLLSPGALAAGGLLDPVPIRALWQLHLSGKNVQHALWNVLMYQAWRMRWA